MSRDDEALEGLLANGHLSGAAYDRIEKRVLARTVRKPARPLGRWLALAAAACGSLGLFVVFTRPSPSMAPSGFTAKGEPSAGSGSVELLCSSEGRPCKRGDTLMFLVDSAVLSGYLSASAVRLEPPSDERVWFFPTVEGDVPHVAEGQGMVVAPKGIRLTNQQPPGSYRVDVWFSESKPDGRVPPGDSAEVVTLRLKIE